MTIETTTEAADIVASVLFDNNIVGAEIEDNQNLSSEELSKMYVDIPKINVDDGKSKVSFYVAIGEKVAEENANIDKNLIDNSYMPSSDNIFKKDEFDAILENIKNELDDYRNFVDMGTLNISKLELDDAVFLKKWKENFKRIEIDDVTILPSWEEASDKGVNIYIEPGNAFGTGQHSTTKLCIKSLKKIIATKNTNNVLDIGSGSGILSIVARKLGAKNIFAIDVDENVEFNLIENLKLNNVENIIKLSREDKFSREESIVRDKIIKINSLSEIDKKNAFVYSFGNILTDDNLKSEFCKIKYDIIIANILAPVIISLIEKCKIQDMLNASGCLVLSGIIKEKENEVFEKIKTNIKYKSCKVDYDEDWVSFTVEV